MEHRNIPDVTTYSNARKNLASAMEQVCDSHEPLIITRSKAEPVVMLSLHDYNSLLETAYLLGNPANAHHLQKSFQQIDEEQAVERPLARGLTYCGYYLVC